MSQLRSPRRWALVLAVLLVLVPAGPALAQSSDSPPPNGGPTATVSNSPAAGRSGAGAVPATRPESSNLMPMTFGLGALVIALIVGSAISRRHHEAQRIEAAYAEH